MRSIALLSLALLPMAACIADGFETDDGAVLLQMGDRYIRFEDGRWTAGLKDGPKASWQMCLWHDEWVFETIPGGEIETCPTLEDDGDVTMAGRFSARKESAPVRYAYRLSPSDNGVHVRCELQKTDALEFTRPGTWIFLFADRDEFDGDERAWAPPTWHGKASASFSNIANQLWLELAGGEALVLDLAKPVIMETTHNEGRYVFRFNVFDEDFEVGDKVVAEYDISFAAIPDQFPGQVTPMDEPLAINSVTPNADTVERFEKLELTIDLSATYDNPYDPNQVALDAVFITPSGREVSVPGFFMVEHKRKVTEDKELMIPQGHGLWKVRFAPAETGEYRWRLTLRDESGEIEGGGGSFEAVAGDNPGFIRVSKADPYYLAFDNGDGHFAIGHNLPIYHTSGQLTDEALRRFADAGENFNRWWMSSRGLGIEWEEELGWYRQASAARVDLVLNWAQELGMYYMMCMDTHQDFRQSGWERNPFNSANGGPCDTPGDWFTNDKAREYYHKRLRYTVARWGYSPHVLCWEFGNEFQGWADSPDSVMLPWHREMSDYLRSIDPFGHPITTSFWGGPGHNDFWKLDNIDIVQTHCYTNDDENVAPRVRRYCLYQREHFEKPHIFGEFGIRSHTTTRDKDPEGWGIHNALWAGLFSFCAGPPMPWWHERYIDALDLYFHFRALADFTADLPLGTAKWQPLDISEPEYADRDRPPEVRDAVVTTLSRWGKPERNEFAVLPDGTTEDDAKPQHLLHGGAHEDIKNPPTFIVNYPEAGNFTVHVDTVSNSGLLRIWVDGEQKAEVDLPCGENLGEESVWREQWNLWETTYDRDISVQIPAGRHTIRIENFGKDWVRVTKYVFEDCRVIDRPNLLLCGMKAEGLAIVWAQNLESSWYNHARDQVPAVDPAIATISGLQDGDYIIEWWQTWKGQVDRTQEVAIDGGRLELALPAVQSDVALKLRRQ